MGYEFLQNKTSDLNDRLDEVKAQTSSKFAIVRDNINMIRKQLEEEKDKGAIIVEKENNFIKLLEQKIDERFAQESQILEDIGNKLSNMIFEKFNALKIEISKESANRYECIENLKTYLENDLPKLNEMLKFEKNKREEEDEIIDKKSNKIIKIQKKI